MEQAAAEAVGTCPQLTIGYFPPHGNSWNRSSAGWDRSAMIRLDLATDLKAIPLECCEHISTLISTAHVVYLNAHDSFPKCFDRQNGRLISEWAGLRPGRTAVRLEAETVTVKGKSLPVSCFHSHITTNLK